MDPEATGRLNAFPAGQRVCQFPGGVEDKCGDNIRNKQVKTDLFRIRQAAMPAICIGISAKTRRDYTCFVIIGLTDGEMSI